MFGMYLPSSIPIPTDIPVLPAVDTWISVKDLVAIGDGIVDDTLILQAAIKQYPTLYLLTEPFCFLNRIYM
jgi:polygalacturonase